MSVLGYFGKKRPGLRMPKGDAGGLGVQYSGAVLRGEKSTHELLQADGNAARAAYDSVLKNDPVLKGHCRT